MSMTPEKINSLSSAKLALISAKASNAGVSIAKERMKNLLFNYYEDLISTALECVSLKEEVASLEAALEESDQENADLRKELNELKSQAETSSSSRAKKSVKKE